MSDFGSNAAGAAGCLGMGVVGCLLVIGLMAVGGPCASADEAVECSDRCCGCHRGVEVD